MGKSDERYEGSNRITGDASAKSAFLPFEMQLF